MNPHRRLVHWLFAGPLIIISVTAVPYLYHVWHAGKNDGRNLTITREDQSDGSAEAARWVIWNKGSSPVTLHKILINGDRPTNGTPLTLLDDDKAAVSTLEVTPNSARLDLYTDRGNYRWTPGGVLEKLPP